MVVRNTVNRSCHFLHRKEGVTQGEPLSMNTYGIGVLPIIRDLQDAQTPSLNHGTRMTQGRGRDSGISWNTSSTSRRGGLPQGYLPEPTKSILVVAPRNLVRAEEFF